MPEPQKQQVIIRGEDGKNYPFPDGTDPVEAAALVRKLTSGGTGAALRVASGDASPITDAVKGATKDLGFADLLAAMENMPGFMGPATKVARWAGRTVAENPVETGEVVGGTLGSVVGGRLGGPTGATMGATVGTGAAKAIGNLAQGKPWSEDVALHSAGSGAMEGAGILLGKGLSKAGRSMLRRALGPHIGELRKMTEFGSKSEDEIADYLVDVLRREGNVNPASVRGMRKMRGRLNEYGQEAKGIIDAKDAAGQEIVNDDILNRVAQRLFAEPKPGGVRPDIQTGGNVTGTINDANKALDTMFLDPNNPMVSGGTMGPRLAHQQMTKLGTELEAIPSARFQADAAPGATASKIVTRSELSNAIKELDPRIAELFGKEHDIMNVLDVIGRRVAEQRQTAPLNIYQVVGLLRGSPEALALGTISRPNVSGVVGHGMLNAEPVTKVLPTLGRFMSPALWGLVNPQENEQ